MSDFPVDDVTLNCLEHSMKGALTFTRPDDADLDDEGPWLVGADYSFNDLLDWIGGTYDPPDLAAEDNPALMPQGEIGGVPCYYDVRIHYTSHDVIRALINEVRRLRG